MKKTTLFLISVSLGAQGSQLYKSNLSAYMEYVGKTYGISVKAPEGFADMGKYHVMWTARKQPALGAGNLYGPVFMSEQKDCMMMYAAEPRNMNGTGKDMPGKQPTKFPLSQITGEIRSALGLYYGHGNPLNVDTAKLDLDDYVSLVSGYEAREMFHADSIYIYDLPETNSSYFFDESLESLRGQAYPYCTGLFICKADRAVMEIKLFFTEQGKNRKSDYLKLLSRVVWYNDDVRQKK